MALRVVWTVNGRPLQAPKLTSTANIVFMIASFVCSVTAHCLPVRALGRRLFFPVRAHVDLDAPAAALAAFHPAFEPRHLGLGRVARHVNQPWFGRSHRGRTRSSDAALLAHVAERHRRAGWEIKIILTIWLTPRRHQVCPACIVHYLARVQAAAVGVA